MENGNGGGGITYQDLTVKALTNIDRSLCRLCALIENLIHDPQCQQQETPVELEQSGFQTDNSDIVMAIMAAIEYYERFPYRLRPDEMFSKLRIVLGLEDLIPGGGTGNMYYDRLKKLDEER